MKIQLMDSHSAAGGAAVGLMTWWRLLGRVPVHVLLLY